MDEANTPKNAPRKAFLVALVASVATHVIALGLLRLPARHEATRPERTITLTGTIVPYRAEPKAQEQPRAAAKPLPRRDVAIVQSRHAASAPAPGSVTAPPAPEASRPPVPQDNPFEGKTWPELLGRRLAATVLLNPDGTVARAYVKPNEISPELAQRLEQALSRVQFPAATADGHGSAEVSTRLCFDERGRLDTAPEECWPNGLSQR